MNRKDQEKVDKVTAVIPYLEGRQNAQEVAKIKEKIGATLQKTREPHLEALAHWLSTKELKILDLFYITPISS